MSTAGYHSRKSTFVLFINKRLVECGALKRACEAVYGAILPKAEKPFLFMSLELRRPVDVNVHPTKGAPRIRTNVEAVQSAVEASGSNGSRTFTMVD